MAGILRDTLARALRKRFADYHDQPALEIGSQVYTYAQLWEQAQALADASGELAGVDGAIGFLGQKSLESYAAILAAVILGRPYVSLNMKFPLERQLHIARESRCRVIIADADTAERRLDLLSQLEIPDSLDHDGIATDPDDGGSSLVYYMFTSGTTGTPKGVMVTRDNLAAYLDAIHHLLQVTPGTRCSQFFDLSFDASVHDVFYTWYCGGTLCPMTGADGTDLIAFARTKRLESWYSVPSVIAMAERRGALTAGALPDLRWGLFVGEALPAVLARRWLDVAPNAAAFNLYGPTEATVTITGTPFDVPFLAANPHPTVPIGLPYPGTDVVLVNDAGDPVMHCGEPGELWAGGTQVVRGYLHDPAGTDRAFVNRSFAGYASQRWYRTGDIVSRESTGQLVFLGRRDDQVKIRGYRAEILEIEEVLRRAAATPEAAVVPWPITSPGCADGVIGFVAGPVDEAAALTNCAAHLPSYLVPARIFSVPALPLNQNGKVDRNALRAMVLENTDKLVSGGGADADQTAGLIAAWAGLFPRQDVTPQSSFSALEGDSMTYVSALIAAERVIGELPANWPQMTIADLTRVRQPSRVSAWTRIDTPITIRAAAILLMIFGHLHYINVDLGTVTPLMLLSGYFFGTLQLGHADRPGFTRQILHPLIDIAAAYYLFALPIIALNQHGLTAADVFLVQDLVNSGVEFRWYIAALVHILMTLAVVLPLARWTSRWAARRMGSRVTTADLLLGFMIGFGAIFYIIVPFLIPQADAMNTFGEARWWRFSFLGQLCVFGGGALLGYRKAGQSRFVPLALIGWMSLISAYFKFVAQGMSLMLAGLALEFVGNLRVPRLIALVLYEVADASLFLYLLQPPISELLTSHGVPRRFIVIAVFVAGLGSNRLWRVLRDRSRYIAQWPGFAPRTQGVSANPAD